jgi:hypothetical protein
VGSVGSRIHRTALAVGVATALSVLAACGPTLYTFNSIPASQVVEQAREADANEHAPYEYYYARAYLDKANEEAAEANYQDAIRFAERANEFGTKALELSRRRMREAGR